MTEFIDLKFEEFPKGKSNLGESCTLFAFFLYSFPIINIVLNLSNIYIKIKSLI